MKNTQLQISQSGFNRTMRIDDQRAKVSWLNAEPKGIQNRSLLNRGEHSIKSTERARY